MMCNRVHSAFDPGNFVPKLSAGGGWENASIFSLVELLVADESWTGIVCFADCFFES